MNIRFTRVVVKVPRDSNVNSVEVTPADLGLDDPDITGLQVIAFPLNSHSIEFISLCNVLTEEEKGRAEQIKHRLNEDILGGLEDEE